LVIFKREFTAIAPRIPEVFKSLASEPTSIYAFLEEPFL
jgi:octaprenyl-diphosphate synthase